MRKVLETRPSSAAQLTTLERGRAITPSLAQVERCATLCDWFAAHGPDLVADEPSTSPDDLELVNHSDIGLSGKLWSADEAGARLLARRMNTGAVSFNRYSASDRQLPIGGIKDSGHGGELSRFGIHELVDAGIRGSRTGRGSPKTMRISSRQRT